ncbi:uncharacterized protein [Branchiostoma lanceolatum]|uniref:uncharacterized protein n=1 Tax=Branchiostoma lanceolatum TaxID=7740 RepID=UPI003456A159
MLTVPGSDHMSISAVQTWVEVARMPLTYTVGPVVRTIDTTSDLVVDAALSYDPEELLSSKGYVYDWKCTYEVTLPLDASKINVANCKKATSSGTGYGGSPDRANDGNNAAGLYNSMSCAHSGGEANPWWMVDLGTQYSIVRVVVYNRVDCCSDRLSPGNIHAGNSPVLVNNPIVGRILNFAGLMYELSVSGVLAQYAGTDCEIMLGCLVQTAPNGERQFTPSLLTHERPPGIIANVSVDVTAGLFPTASLYQTIHVVPDETLLDLYLDCVENCNQYSTIAAWPLVLNTSSEIQGTIDYTLEEYPDGHPAENWTSVIEVSGSALLVPSAVFVDVGHYTIRLTDTVGPWQKISEWRFQVLPNPAQSQAGDDEGETTGGDPESLSGMCTLLPPEGTALIDKFCVTCKEFLDVLGPLETQVSFELKPLAEIATVTFPGDGPPTKNEIILNSFNGWVGYTNLFDVSSGIVILHVRIGSPDGRFVEFDLEPALIKAPTMAQLQGYLDGFIAYPTGTFFRQIRQGEPHTAFLGSVIASYVASHMAVIGEDITEGVDKMASGLSELDIEDMETANGVTLSLIMLTAAPEMVSGNAQVLSANLLSASLETTRELSTNITEMPTVEVNKAAALMFTG